MVTLSRVSGVFSLLGLAAVCTGWAASAPAQKEVSYNEHIQPIFAENCFHCHGPDSGTRKGKLRLDLALEATQPRGDREAAIKPGNPKESPVIERILSTDSEEQMPPPESHKKLKPDEIARLQRWIEQGAKYEEHWSLLAPQRPAVPELPRGFPAAWSKSPIDRFLAETLASSGLKPSREDDRARLLRRASFDLTGLPPTPEDLKAFAADRAPDAYERAVDRLLATDASAEHFARYWLDAVRYADTHGIHIDNYRSIWPYRDWVVNAFRQNMPFDQFTVEQVAGDLLPNATLEQKIASGFNRCLPTTSEGGAITEEYEAIYAKDRVETLSTVWLGLTTGCASCHDHKFDPVSQKDFYALAAFFRNNTMPAMDGNRHDTPPTLFVPAVADRNAWEKLQTEISGLKRELQARSKAADADFDAWLATAKALHRAPTDRNVRLARALVETAGAASTGIEGPFGPAPKLNDADLVLGPPVPWLRERAESFSLFVRVEQKPNGTLLSCLDAEAKTAGWALFLEDGKLGLHVADDQGAVKVRNVSNGTLTPGKWHHVLLSFDTASIRSRTIEVFLDGRGVVNSGVSAHLPADIRPSAPLRLGSRHGADGKAANSLTGGEVWVQDFRHYDRGFFAPDAKAVADQLEAYAGLQAAPEKRTGAQKKQLREHFLEAVDGPSLAVAAKIDRLLVQEDAMRARGGLTLVMEEKADSEPFAHVLTRGEYSQPGEKVGPAVPSVLPSLPADAPRNRLGLARWIVAPTNPLTARVTVNRAWQQVFGTGLVESSGDFGVMGARPSHPRLLDWLAVDFRESGWDFRRLMRQLVTSAAYRQSAAASPELRERDPENRLLARGPRYRLDAEQLRDQVLAASGLLVAKLGGRPARPYQPEGIWEEVAMKESTTRFYRPDAGENLYRRSLYTIWKRTAAPPAMELLNAPSREVACVRRDRTNTPLQALVTMNEPLFVEASRQLATRVMREATRFDARLDAVSLRLLGRTFSREERAVLRRTHDDALAVYERDPALAPQLLGVGQSPVDPKLPAPELAAWTLVASQVMNLDESLTK
jgi:mono/diheme cytochrome c family protein/cytochrome c553